MKKVSVPAGESGDWKVEKFSISEEKSRNALSSYGCRAPAPGEYTRLVCKGRGTVMSDTGAEMRDHLEPVRRATGHILIHGLGLGMVLFNSMMKKRVERATVIELSADVIKLVGPHYQMMYGDRLDVIQADAMKWKPPKGVRYGMVWHDIWDAITTDNLPEMKFLHRRYGRLCDWQSSWCRHEVNKLHR